MIEYDYVKFPKSISSNDGVWREVIEIGSKSTLPKKWVLEKRDSLILFFSQ